ncbi:MAG: type II toxin-antitoxin system VapC family toxin [Solirubrobacteraceae bacterium]
MRVLLDTHVLLWAAAGEVEPVSRRRIEHADVVAVSAASIWEIEIKRAAGRLEAPLDVAERALEQGFEALHVRFAHALETGRLPLHHRDPFDRMLVAQARVEGMTLASADSTLAEYDVPVLPVSRR